MAAPAHLTAMDGGNAVGLQEQSLPCASRHLHIHVQWRECRGLSGTIPAMQSRAGVAKRHGLAPGKGPHGERIAHRRGTELFQWRIELQVEVRVFRLLDQYPATVGGDTRATSQVE